jgi:hypothetical protein
MPQRRGVARGSTSCALLSTRHSLYTLAFTSEGTRRARAGLAPLPVRRMRGLPKVEIHARFPKVGKSRLAPSFATRVWALVRSPHVAARAAASAVPSTATAKSFSERVRRRRAVRHPCCSR